MDAREYWNHYVTENGGPNGVAAKLRIPYSTIAGICNGNRGIGHRLAERMAAADQLLDAKRLVWVRANPSRRTKAASDGKPGETAKTDGIPVPKLKDAA